MSGGIGRFWAMVDNVTGKPMPNDLYATPTECVLALLPHIRDFPPDIWEPAAGGGAISRVSGTQGYRVVSTDLHNYEFGQSGLNFLMAPKALAPAVITNPPYGKSHEGCRKGSSGGLSCWVSRTWRCWSKAIISVRTVAGCLNNFRRLGFIR